MDVSSHVETVCLLSKLSEVKNHISVKVDMNEMDLTAAESKATYQEIKEWVKEKYREDQAKMRDHREEEL